MIPKQPWQKINRLRKMLANRPRVLWKRTPPPNAPHFPSCWVMLGMDRSREWSWRPTGVEPTEDPLEAGHRRRMGRDRYSRGSIGDHRATRQRRMGDLSKSGLRQIDLEVFLSCVPLQRTWWAWTTKHANSGWKSSLYLGATGLLLCLDLAKGELIWKQDLLELGDWTQAESEAVIAWDVVRLL